MYVDAQLEFSDAQAITASAASDNLVDLNPAFDYNDSVDIGAGEAMHLVITPSVTFESSSGTAVTLQAQLRAYGKEDLSDTPVVVLDTSTISVDNLVSGRPFVFPIPPGVDAKRFLSLYYTVSGGNFTAGSVDAFITKDVQTYRPYANNSEFADLDLS